jgi:hypothetical protein
MLAASALQSDRTLPINATITSPPIAVGPDASLHGDATLTE